VSQVRINAGVRYCDPRGLKVFAELPATITALWVEGDRLYASTPAGVYEVFQDGRIRRLPAKCAHGRKHGVNVWEWR
jgi:hypothetical protein